MAGAPLSEIDVVVHDSPGPITDHLFHVFVDFPCPDVALTRRLTVLSPAVVDSKDRIGLIHPGRREATGSGSRLFVESVFEIGDDLHPSVLVALTGRDPAPEKGPRGVGCLRLSASGRAILNGDWARPPGDPRQIPGYLPHRGMSIRLGRDSRQRIQAASRGAAPETLIFTIVDVILLTLGTQTGLVIAQCQLRGDTIQLSTFQEAIHIVAHAGRHGSLAWACHAEPVSRFTLPDVISCLLDAAGCTPRTWNRVYTYTFALFSAFPSERRAMHVAAWRLSRRYTDAYSLGPDAIRGGAVFQPFDDVVHAASLEGAATLSAASSTFLAEGLRDRVSKSYLPLSVLAYHEHVQLIDMAQQAAIKGNLAGERAIHDLVGRYLEFRLRCRLPVVSDLTMHNVFYEDLRQGLQLDTLSRKIADDTAQVAQNLQQMNARAAREAQALQARNQLRRERRYAPIVGMFAGLLTFLTAATAFKEITEAAKPLWVAPEWMPLAIAIVLGAISWAVAWNRHNISHSGDHLTDRATEDYLGEELQTEAEGEAAHISAELHRATAI